MRALLIHPPVLPYGYTLHHRFQRVWEVAEYLRRHYPNTTVLDAGLLNMLKGQILSEFATGYDVVAVYCEPHMLPTAADLVERLRYMSPDTKVMAYGPAAVCFPDETRTLCDAIGLRGDMDAQLRQFFDLMSGRAELTTNISVLTDTGWSTPTGAAEFVPAAEWGFPPLDEMPISDVDRIYQMKDQPLTIAVTASRGCPYRCTFCATPDIEGRPDRRRPAAALADYVADHATYRNWQFYSPTFTLDRQWCLDFFAHLRARTVRIKWRCTTRVDRLDKQLVEEMATSGCRMVGLGVETLGPALVRAKKGISRHQVTHAIKLLLTHGIHVKAYIILGLPGQSVSDVKATIDFVTDLGAQIRPTLYSPQGMADGLDNASIVGLDAVGEVDRKSFLSHRENYGEFLRLAFDRRISSPAM